MTCTVTWNSLIAGICWLLGMGMAVADVFLDLHLTALAVSLICIASVRTIKGYVDRHDANWTAAYEVGREVEKVRRIR